MKKPALLFGLTLLSVVAIAQPPTLIGKRLYAQHCMTCHQADGSGAQNMIPPLTKSEFVVGSKAELIKIVLNGLNGEIKVNGDIYAGEMPSHAKLKDSEIASILTYIRRSFGNQASRVTATEVRKIRVSKKKVKA